MFGIDRVNLRGKQIKVDEVGLKIRAEGKRVPENKWSLFFSDFNKQAGSSRQREKEKNIAHPK